MKRNKHSRSKFKQMNWLLKQIDWWTVSPSLCWPILNYVCRFRIWISNQNSKGIRIEFEMTSWKVHRKRKGKTWIPAQGKEIHQCRLKAKFIKQFMKIKLSFDTIRKSVQEAKTLLGIYHKLTTQVILLILRIVDWRQKGYDSPELKNSNFHDFIK